MKIDKKDEMQLSKINKSATVIYNQPKRAIVIVGDDETVLALTLEVAIELGNEILSLTRLVDHIEQTK